MIGRPGAPRTRTVPTPTRRSVGGRSAGRASVARAGGRDENRGVRQGRTPKRAPSLRHGGPGETLAPEQCEHLPQQRLVAGALRLAEVDPDEHLLAFESPHAARLFRSRTAGAWGESARAQASRASPRGAGVIAPLAVRSSSRTPRRCPRGP